MKKILVIAPSWVGDLIMAQSLFKLLKRESCHLTVMAPEWNFHVLQRMPEVDDSFLIPLNHGEFKLKIRYQIGKEMRERGFTQAIVLPNSFKSALIPFFAKIPLRTGWVREGRRLLLNDGRVLDKKNTPLMVQRYLALGYPRGKAWDKNDIPLPRLSVCEKVQADTLFQLGIKSSIPFIAMAPGTAATETKRWPEQYFAEVANQLLEQGYQVILFGSSKDKPVCQTIDDATSNRCRNLCGELQLFQTLDILAAAKCLLSNDSGLLHMAAAVETPVIGVYGSTSPEFTPPLAEKKVILQHPDLACRPCFKKVCAYNHLRCLTEIHPSQVFGALNTIL